MRTLIVLVLGLLAVGCLTPEQKQQKALEQKQKAFRDSVVGEYEFKREDGDTLKRVLLDTGIVEWYRNGRKGFEYKWSIVNEEIHVIDDFGLIVVWRINKDKSITEIAYIRDGKRKDYSDGSTWKKIK